VRSVRLGAQLTRCWALRARGPAAEAVSRYRRTEEPARPTLEGLTEQPRGGRRDNRPLEESPDTAGQGGRGADPGKPAGKCHRNTPPKRRATAEPGAGKGEKVR
jgi:hypothetical protein